MQWQYKRSFDGSKGPTGEMDPKLTDIKYDWKDKVIAGAIQFYTDNKCAYKIL